MSKSTYDLMLAPIAGVYRPTQYVAPPKESWAHLPLVTMAPDSSVLMSTLYHALSLRRGDGSGTEAAFVAWLCNRMPVTMVDGAGNIHVDTRSLPSHRSMFTAHTDTVHPGGGANTIRLDGKKWRAEGAALGADDGAGIALMAHMIHHGVPGYYVFFRGEECGGVGSNWLAENMPQVFAGIDRAVAFDRADYSDVITHQAGGRCCSNAFAEALSTQLNDNNMLFMPCDAGVFTDTANLTHLVPECTNLSVGYKHQHGDREWQDVAFLQQLAAAVVQVQWDELPTARDPKAVESKWGAYSKPSVWAEAGNRFVGSMDYDGAGYDEFGAEDDITTDLMGAIEDALIGNSAVLADYLAAHLHPEDKALAHRHIKIGRVSQRNLERALDELMSGAEPEWVLDELLDAAQSL